MTRAFLFDFDGVVVDSEPVHLETFRTVLAPLGIGISKKRWYREFVGAGSPFIMKTLLGEKKITDEEIIKRYVNERRELFQKRILEGKIWARRGIEKFLLETRKNGIKTAIVSGGHKQNIALSLSLLNLEKAFDVVIGREDYEKRKPDPECYLLAAKKIGVEPRDCVVFEDSILGCLAAKAAGMIVIVVEAPVAVEKGGCNADAKIKDFEGLSPNSFDKL